MLHLLTLLRWHVLQGNVMKGTCMSADTAANSDIPPHTRRARRLAAVEVPALSSLEVFLSTEKRAPIDWDFTRIKYSLTIPSEAVAAAVVAVVNSAYEDVALALYRPDDGKQEVLLSGVPSSFVAVPTEEAAKFTLEVQLGAQASNYTIAVLRSTISSYFAFAFPDPAESMPPQATLSGLQVFNMYGVHARIEPSDFEPMRSQYVASVDMEMAWAFVIATKNDPEGVLQLRIDGQDWLALESGVNSQLLAVPDRGWLLLEVRVSSPMVAMQGLPGLIYQVVLNRAIVCHERCRSCFGPAEDQCLSCRAPLVLFKGRCDATACPPDGYFEWESFQCRRCDPSCAQCRGPGQAACILCPALHFLSPDEFQAPSGPCTISCPVGKAAHPQSRRCRRPPTMSIKTFYIRFLFRIAFEDMDYNPTLQKMVLNTSAFVLGVSLSDVRAYTMRLKTYALEVTVEVVSPFLAKADADNILIDTWFGAFEVPVDEVIPLTWDAVHPALPKLEEDPLIPAWAWGFISSFVMSFFVICPLYCFFFRRMNNTRKKYMVPVTSPVFMDLIVHQSPAWLIKRFMAHESGEKAHISDGGGD